MFVYRHIPEEPDSFVTRYAMLYTVTFSNALDRQLPLMKHLVN